MKTWALAAFFFSEASSEVISSRHLPGWLVVQEVEHTAVGAQEAVVSS
jgi:hypothetical protein